MIIQKMKSEGNIRSKLRILKDIEEINNNKLFTNDSIVKISDIYNFKAEEKYVIFVKIYPDYDSFRNTENLFKSKFTNNVNNKSNNINDDLQGCLSIDFTIVFTYEYPFDSPVIYHNKNDFSQINKINLNEDVSMCRSNNIFSGDLQITNSHGFVDLNMFKMYNRSIPTINSIIYNLDLHVINKIRESYRLSLNPYQNLVDRDNNQYSNYYSEEIREFNNSLSCLPFINKIINIPKYAKYKLYSSNRFDNSQGGCLEIIDLHNQNLVNINSYKYHDGFVYSQYHFLKLIKSNKISDFNNHSFSGLDITTDNLSRSDLKEMINMLENSKARKKINPNLIDDEYSQFYLNTNQKIGYNNNLISIHESGFSNMFLDKNNSSFINDFRNIKI